MAHACPKPQWASGTYVIGSTDISTDCHYSNQNSRGTCRLKAKVVPADSAVVHNVAGVCNLYLAQWNKRVCHRPTQYGVQSTPYKLQSSANNAIHLLSGLISHALKKYCPVTIPYSLLNYFLEDGAFKSQSQIVSLNPLMTLRFLMDPLHERGDRHRSGIDALKFKV